MACGMALRRTCWRAGAIFAPCRNYLVMPMSKRRRSIPMSLRRPMGGAWRARSMAWMFHCEMDFGGAKPPELPPTLPELRPDKRSPASSLQLLLGWGI
jgi:hypothetical protein